MNNKIFIRSLRIFDLKTATIFFVLAVLFFLLVPPVFAALDTGLEYGTITGLGTQDLRITIMKIVRVILGLVGIIAIVIIIYGGYIWMTSAGNPEKIDQAKKILTNAVIGLIIIFSAFAIVSFIIGALETAMGIRRPPGPMPPPPGCEGCQYLGGGIIESVYPVPLSKDNPRDTVIIVTFKEEINPETIMNVPTATVCDSTPANPCSNKDLAQGGGKPNIRIYKSAEDEDQALAANQVKATSKDMKTYVFEHVPLGDSVARYWYTVKLTNQLTKNNDNKPAFGGVSDYFSWSFEVGTKFDLAPPQISSVFPIPDNEPDSYTPTSGTPAQGRIQVNKQPNIGQAAANNLVTECNDGIDNNGSGGADTADSTCSNPNDITAEGNPDSSVVSVGGAYNGIYAGTIDFHVNSDATQIQITRWTYFDAAADGYYTNGATYSIDSTTKRVDLLRGLVLVFQEPTTAVNQNFSLALTPQTAVDRLQIANTIYTFIPQGATAGPSEIALTAIPGSTSNLSALATAIASKIQDQTQSPNILATSAGATINLTAQLAGRSGNFINVSATGNWATVTYPEVLGRDESIAVTCSANGICDQPRNVVIRIDFNEGMLPPEVSGKIETNNDNSINGAGTLKASDFSNILVQADLDNADGFEADEYISGTWDLSNQYKTAEFISLVPCQDRDGNEIINSCGKPVQCLPINPASNQVKYKVTIKAAALRTCTDDNYCSGLAYENGTQTDDCRDISPGSPSPVCSDGSGTIFYPKAKNDPYNGVVDAASNSFDANKDGYTQGPQNQSQDSPYDLNNPNVAFGDDLVWQFFINNKVDLTAPIVLEVSPTVGGSGTSLLSPLTATFNKLLKSSTVKPDSGYIDGRCTCNNDGDCPDADQKCINNLCVNQSQEQRYCGKDEECKSGFVCQTKKYVTLYDYTSRPVAWWVSNVGDDIRMCLDDVNLYRECGDASNNYIAGTCLSESRCSLKDSYSDRSIAQINHTALLESTEYSAEMGSGIEDIYQNCYVPGKGPVSDICDPWAGSGCCAVTVSGAPPQPYCCEGVPSANPCVP